MSEVGKSMDRVDGRLKVTGSAQYTADIQVADVVYAVIVQSTIARGRIKSIDTSAAERLPGILGVLTHLNAPRLQEPPAPQAGLPPSAPQPPRGPEGRGLLQDDVVHYSGQHVAVAIADTLERATHAASLVRVTYAEERPVVNFEGGLSQAIVPSRAGIPPRGDADGALRTAKVWVDQRYTTPIEHHNPLGPFATIAVWDGSRLTVYDTTQGVFNARNALAAAFGLSPENVRVISHFVGGGFGAGLRAWAHPTLAAMAARLVNRPVKLVLTREQMYTSVGYRNPTIQRVRLGATREGQLAAIIHEGFTPTARFNQFGGGLTNKATMLYACPNVRTDNRLVQLDVAQATPMRAPGTAEGMFALECAMDELAYAVGLDPIELRLRNYAEVDPQSGNPWSSKSLKECYRLGAERFGWARRTPKPRSMRDGRFLVGLGMATTCYEVNRRPASALVRILADGSVVVQSGGSDIGPGTYTVMGQIAADALGLPKERVRVELADSNLPDAPVQGGSALLASVGSAVHEAALAARAKVINIAREDSRSSLSGAVDDHVVVEGGQLFLKGNPSAGETYATILTRRGVQFIEAKVESGAQRSEAAPTASANIPSGTREQERSARDPEYSKNSFGAQFAEVRVAPDTGEVRVTRFVGVFAAGRIINPKTARSQMIGGIVGGLGMALMEETRMDLNFGRYTNANFADYLVPVHADIPDIDIHFIDEQDPHVNPLGAKGIGELCIVGVAPAIANAIYHATGKRIRDLPITPEKLL